ncbi:MAG: dethiobiotin synthase [Candidatus Nitrotoga sp.]|jgi:dethiobiotin synthetase|nr:dethiobiotin synthase [Candidatus Nitrotoga sp.]MDW7604369.1 dethiobiotin synthase [Candidatus Nitrotoga sp.]MDW7612384.1 dethiobiotin synthase [Candidatus Nitrotoga sp.]MDW7625746.1 dethiobiotin synthase [Candidatus Nitrotoga sp.]
MSFFVTGTDTGVGKTLIGCALLYAFAQQGRRVVGMKPVASGCDKDGQNHDVKQLQAASNVPADYDQINTYGLLDPIAPHIAAQNAGVHIELASIVTAYRALASRADVVIVEGIGGFAVPLNDSQGIPDLAMELGLPVILVVGIRLGCLNHALLTASAIEACGLKCAGWVANVLEPDMLAAQASVVALKKRLNAPLIGVVPWQILPDAKSSAPKLQLELLGQA